MSTVYWFRTGLFVLSLAATHVHADDAPVPGIVVVDAQSAVRDEVHYLTASIDYVLSPQIIEALDEGVPLTVVLAIEIVRERAWMWNEKVAGLEQRYQISYHALTRQYLVLNLNIGAQHSYPSLEAALLALGTIVSLPLIDANLLLPEQRYLGRMQARIDTSTLPAPLRLIALVSPEWRLTSEWREWAF